LTGGRRSLSGSLARLVTTSDEQSSSSRASLPEGTIPVGIGLLVAGFASFAFLRVGKNAMGGDDAFAPVLSLWFATFALAPGFFLPLEQELGRAISARRALGQGGRPVVRKVAMLGVLLAGTVIAVILAFGSIITESYFDGDWVLLVALVVAFASYAPVHLARGIASGSGRFRAYAVVMGADGAVRVVLCIVLAIVGATSAGAYGMAVAVAPLAGFFWVLGRGQLRTDDGPPATWGEVTPNLGWLLLGSVFAAGLVNAGPVAANLLKADGQEELVTQFGYGVLLSRIPLFLFQAVQAALLPRLAGLAARNELAEFRAGFRKLMMLVVAVGVAGIVGSYLVGPFVIEKMYGATLSNRTMAMLALGSAAYMAALAMAQAVIALKGHALVALGWGIGMVAFILVTWLSSDDLFRRIEYGLVASSVAALIAFAISLRARLRAGVTPSDQSMMEAIIDMPFES
jgi:O-antigen/teichoic acid export membrane protein